MVHSAGSLTAADLLPFAVKVLTFTLLFTAFAGRVVPPTARLAVALALGVGLLQLPAVRATDGELVTALLVGVGNARVQFVPLLHAVFQAALLAVAAGAGLLAVRLAARWIGSTRFNTAPPDTQATPPGQHSIETALMLVGVLVWFSTPLTPLLWKVLGVALGGGMEPQPTSSLVQFGVAGAAAFSGAAMLAAPFFLLLLFADTLVMFGRRYSPVLFEEGLTGALRTVLVVLLLSLLLYSLVDAFTRLGEDGLRRIETLQISGIQTPTLRPPRGMS